MNYRIDNLQYCNWSKEIFDINHEAKLDAVHATICYHEDFDELQINIEKWKQYLCDKRTMEEVEAALVSITSLYVELTTLKDKIYNLNIPEYDDPLI